MPGSIRQRGPKVWQVRVSLGDDLDKLLARIDAHEPLAAQNNGALPSAGVATLPLCRLAWTTTADNWGLAA